MSRAEEYNEKGIYFVKNSQIDEALKYFDKALEEDSKFLDVYYNKAISYLTTENFDGALECYEKILEIDPTEGEAYHQKGNIMLFVNEDLDEALRLYNKATFLGVKNINLFYNTCICHQKKGNIDQAFSWNERAIKLEPKRVELLNKKGELYIALGKLKEAVEVYNDVLMIDVTNEEANHFKAIVLGEMGNTEEALKALEFSEEILKDSLLIQFDKVLIYEKLGQLDKALEYLDVCERMDETNVTILNKKAELYVLLEKVDKAIEVYDKMTEINPDNYEVYFSKATILTLSNRFKEANEVYKHIIQNADDENPYKINSYYYNALTIKASGEENYLEAYNEAIKKYTNLILYYQYDAYIYMLKANSYRDINKFSEAEELYEFAIDLKPEFAEVYLMRAKNRIRQNNLQDAKKDIEKALSLSPSYQKIIDMDEEFKKCV